MNSSTAKGIVTTINIFQESSTTNRSLVRIHSPKMGRDKAIAVWKALIDAKSGKVRAIGVSNAGEIKDLVDNRRARVNQIQYTRGATSVARRGRGLGRPGRRRQPTTRRRRPLSTATRWKCSREHRAERYFGQRVVRWARARGCAVIPGSTPAHIAENLQTLEQLTPSEVSRIDASAAPDGWWSPRGPNKYGDEDARTPWRDAAPAKKRRRHHRMEH